MDDTLELIKALPQELQEQILKEYIKTKIQERQEMGWGGVIYSIIGAPWCETNQQIAKCWICHFDDECEKNGQCDLCKKNGVYHKLDHEARYKKTTEVTEPILNGFAIACVFKLLEPFLYKNVSDCDCIA